MWHAWIYYIVRYRYSPYAQSQHEGVQSFGVERWSSLVDDKLLLKDVTIELLEIHGHEGGSDRQSFSEVFGGSLSVSGKIKGRRKKRSENYGGRRARESSSRLRQTFLWCLLPGSRVRVLRRKRHPMSVIRHLAVGDSRTKWERLGAMIADGNDCKMAALTPDIQMNQILQLRQVTEGNP